MFYKNFFISLGVALMLAPAASADSNLASISFEQFKSFAKADEKNGKKWEVKYTKAPPSIIIVAVLPADLNTDENFKVDAVHDSINNRIVLQGLVKNETLNSLAKLPVDKVKFKRREIPIDLTKFDSIESELPIVWKESRDEELEDTFEVLATRDGKTKFKYAPKTVLEKQEAGIKDKKERLKKASCTTCEESKDLNPEAFPRLRSELAEIAAFIPADEREEIAKGLDENEKAARELKLEGKADEIRAKIVELRQDVNDTEDKEEIMEILVEIQELHAEVAKLPVKKEVEAKKKRLTRKERRAGKSGAPAKEESQEQRELNRDLFALTKEIADRLIESGHSSHATAVGVFLEKEFKSPSARMEIEYAVEEAGFDNRIEKLNEAAMEKGYTRSFAKKHARELDLAKKYERKVCRKVNPQAYPEFQTKTTRAFALIPTRINKTKAYKGPIDDSPEAEERCERAIERTSAIKAAKSTAQEVSYYLSMGIDPEVAIGGKGSSGGWGVPNPNQSMGSQGVPMIPNLQPTQAQMNGQQNLAKGALANNQGQIVWPHMSGTSLISNPAMGTGAMPQFSVNDLQGGNPQFQLVQPVGGNVMQNGYLNPYTPNAGVPQTGLYNPNAMAYQQGNFQQGVGQPGFMSF